MRKAICSIAVGLILAACGDGDPSGPTTATTSIDQAEVGGAAPAGSSYDRSAFVLCPALEDHRDELASMVGFEADPQRSLSVMRSECAVRGKGGNFVRVSMLPALVRSARQHAELSFDAPSSPLPELGAEAWLVADPYQPRAVFEMGGLLFDVDVVAPQAPDRATIASLAARIQTLLAEANGAPGS